MGGRGRRSGLVQLQVKLIENGTARLSLQEPATPGDYDQEDEWDWEVQLNSGGRGRHFRMRKEKHHPSQ